MTSLRQISLSDIELLRIQSKLYKLSSVILKTILYIYTLIKARLPDPQN